ncbi:Uncharacterized protein YjbI, contains pentapeptide repeats [Cohaesibacter gelatinilyticus]|uniref:Uncharacterized protein YjbI, contains pentapeptide repeats n=2 Tax=Cohaesibacter gelatinilyticus TaxID=372072 RepID=A0A285PLF4_9HYPH|nr:Uncharacterized protein YjbI, contains pentapeptide repeats [Cohaesibacter gelatinilyticus]
MDGRLILAFALGAGSVLAVLLWFFLGDFGITWPAGLESQESLSAIVRNWGLLPLALIGMGLAVWRSKIASDQRNIAQQAQFADRYAKAASMLSDSALSIREAGIFALKELALADPEGHYIPAQSLLCSFIRDRSKVYQPDNQTLPPVPKSGYDSTQCESDIKEALRAFLMLRTPETKNIEDRQKWRPDLNGSHLVGIDVRYARPDRWKRIRVPNEVIPAEGIPIRLEFVGADPVRVDLSGVNLMEVNLSGAKLEGADLSEANLGRADLREASLFDANLREANLVGANLGEATLSGADLSDADLSEANLVEAKLESANLGEARLVRADLRKVNFVGAKLNSASLWEANLFGACLNDAELGRAVLNEVDLSEAYLYRANLSGARLCGANLRRAQLDGANLSNACMCRTSLSDANFNGADLSKTCMCDASLSGANFSGANLNGICPNGARLIQAITEGTQGSNVQIDRKDIPET